MKGRDCKIDKEDGAIYLLSLKPGKYLLSPLTMVTKAVSIFHNVGAYSIGERRKDHSGYDSDLLQTFLQISGQKLKQGTVVRCVACLFHIKILMVDRSLFCSVVFLF